MRRSAQILLAALTVSAAAHAWLLWSARSSVRVNVSDAPEQTIEVAFWEEVPPSVIPAPLSTPEPTPEATPEPTPLPPEPVLASEAAVNDEVTPLPAPTPESKPVATPKPKPKPAPQKPAPAPPAVPAKPKAPAFVEAKPDYARNPPPRYPETARRQGWAGTVIVRASVDPSGRPSSVTLHKSSGYGVLDQAALAAVRGWKFVPRRVNGGAVAATVEVPVNFSLNR